MISSDAILTSSLTPVLRDGRISSYSYSPEEFLAAHYSFVSAWDLLLERIGRELTLIGSSDEPEGFLRNHVRACACVRACALSEGRGSQHTSSVEVSERESQT